MPGNHDHLIDDVARDLTRGDPSPQLRQSVRARIDKPRVRWSIPAWAPALVAVVLVLVVARTLSGPRGEPDLSTGSGSSGTESSNDKAPPTHVAQVQSPDVGVPASQSAPSREAGQSPRFASAHTRAQRVPLPAESVAAFAAATAPKESSDSNQLNDANEFESTPIIAPLTIEPLALPPLAVGTSSGMMPIDIAPLQIEPLQPE